MSKKRLTQIPAKNDRNNSGHQEAKTGEPLVNSDNIEPGKSSGKVGVAPSQAAMESKEEKSMSQAALTQSLQQAGVDQLKRVTAAWVDRSHAYQGDQFEAANVQHPPIQNSDMGVSKVKVTSDTT